MVGERRGREVRGGEGGREGGRVTRSPSPRGRLGQHLRKPSDPLTVGCSWGSSCPAWRCDQEGGSGEVFGG